MATIDQGLQRAVDYCRSRRIPLIMGADSNAHSTLWGPTKNQRGGDFEDFLHRNDLYVLNDGLKPTYYHWANGSRTKTYIDITVVNTFAINKNLGGEWTVSDEETLSDHKMVTFLASASLEPPRLARNLKNVDWALFRADVDARIMTQTWDMDIHQRAAAFIQVITAVLDEQAPPTAPKPKTKPRWWTEELENMRKTLDRMARRKSRRPEQREERANLQRDYKLAIKSARKESFRKFCSSPRSVSELAGMVKALTNKPSYSALIVDSRGRVPETHAGSHNNLLNHHFPSHQTQRSQSWGALRAATRDGLEDPIMELLTPQIVRNALHSFGPKKSPGPDGLRPKVLQNLGWVAICLLTDIYRESIASSTIPNSFLHMKVIFLPKDKPDKSSPKSYRPITLSSFFP